MNKRMKITLAAAGALMLAGAAGVATLEAAGSEKGWRYAHAGKYWGGHHGRGHHWRGHRGRGRGIEWVLERFDTDKDGKLTQEELNKARSELLARFDKDKDAKLSLDEFEPLWAEVMRKRMVRGFQWLDADGNAQITEDEFLKPFAYMVERMDRNNDGAIGRDDRKRHHGPHHGPHHGKGKEGMHHRGSHGPDKG
jgi:hypothetical protein